ERAEEHAQQAGVVVRETDQVGRSDGEAEGDRQPEGGDDAVAAGARDGATLHLAGAGAVDQATRDANSLGESNQESGRRGRDQAERQVPGVEVHRALIVGVAGMRPPRGFPLSPALPREGGGSFSPQPSPAGGGGSFSPEPSPLRGR